MELNRRDFLKLSGATATVTAGTLGSMPLDLSAQTKLDEVGKWIPTTCQGCTSWCSAEAYVFDNRVIKVRGNENSKATEGHICPRPHLAIQQMYDPDRVVTPMKRTNPKKGRGVDPKFVPISWDEALDTIADKMMELRENNESEKFAVFRGRYSYMRDILYSGLPKIFGSPNGISHSSICAEAEKFGSFYTEGVWDYKDFDLEHTKYILSWGADPLASNRQTPHFINIWGKVKDNGHITVVDPRLSATAAKANTWVPIIPGADGAMAIAIAHTILVNGLWSKEFVGDFTEGKNLFVEGQDVDESLFDEKFTHGVVKWWNLELKDKTAQWAEDKVGISAKEIEKIAFDFANAAPRAISWVSPGATMQVRGGYNSLACHALNGLVGSVEQKGGVCQKLSPPVNHMPNYKTYQDSVAKKKTKYQKIDQRGYVDYPAMKKGKAGKGVITNHVADAMLAKDPYELKVVIGYWNNFVFSCTGAQRWEKAMEELPFFAHITTNVAEMTQYADIVLPAKFSMFEKFAFIKNKQNLHGYCTLQQPVVKPVFKDVRSDETEIPFMLAQKLAKKGFSAYLEFLQEEYKDPETGKKANTEAEFEEYALKYYTKPLWDGTHKNNGVEINSWKDFKKIGVWNTKKVPYKKHWGKFKTKTHQYEFYSETLKYALSHHAEKKHTDIDNVLKVCNYEAKGELAFVPHYEEPYRFGEEKEFPLVFTEHRSRLNREARSANTSWYHMMKDVDPGDVAEEDVAKMNPITARKYNMKDGDMIQITSINGSITCKLKTWEGIRPGQVTKCYGQGHWAYGRVASLDFHKAIPRGANTNELMVFETERLSGSNVRHGGHTRVRIEKVQGV